MDTGSSSQEKWPIEEIMFFVSYGYIIERQIGSRNLRRRRQERGYCDSEKIVAFISFQLSPRNSKIEALFIVYSFAAFLR
jgi:hypothetical protein